MSHHWIAENIPDLTGKGIIVTGANSGIGYETALVLAGKGATVVMACRNLDKAQAALNQIQGEIPHAKAEVMQLDLSRQASVHAFTETFMAKYRQLDVLVNNAGIMWVPYGTTEDGFERQFGTNHLGHFALTGLLLEPLLTTPRSRVVNVSSTGHRTGRMDFDNLMFEGGQDYSQHGAYARSKLANLLFTYELQRRLAAAGSSSIAVAAHPGASGTNLGSHLTNQGLGMRLFMTLGMAIAQSSAMGALPTLRAAVGADVRGGDYYGPKGFMEMRGYPVKVKSSQASHNTADAQRLWQISETLTGVRYTQITRGK